MWTRKSFSVAKRATCNRPQNQNKQSHLDGSISRSLARLLSNKTNFLNDDGRVILICCYIANYTASSIDFAASFKTFKRKKICQRNDLLMVPVVWGNYLYVTLAFESLHHSSSSRYLRDGVRKIPMTFLQFKLPISICRLAFYIQTFHLSCRILLCYDDDIGKFGLTIFD